MVKNERIEKFWVKLSKPFNCDVAPLRFKIVTRFNTIFCRIFRLFSVRTSQTTTGLYSTRKLEVMCTVSSTPCVSTFGQLYFRCKNAARDRKYVIVANKTKLWITLRNCPIVPCCLFGRHCNWTLMEAD